MADNKSILFSRAQLFDGSVADLLVRDGRVAAIGPNLPRPAGARLIEARGGLLLPGLKDHHCHLFATAAARRSVDCGPPQVQDEGMLEEVLRRAAMAGEPTRGVGFHESVCAHLDRHWLDRVCPDVPLRIQHRSGMLWIYNSAAIAQLPRLAETEWPEGVERDQSGEATGRFYNLDAWLRQHANGSWPQLTRLSQEYARSGVTAVTDTGVNNGLSEWRALQQACDKGEWLQRLQIMGTAELNGVAADGAAFWRGPRKLYLRESNLPDLDLFCDEVAQAHRESRAVAIHCVTLVELHFALEAIAMAGALAGDRIEHASVADDAAIERMADLAITAVTQPHFIAQRGDQYLQSVEAENLPLLYRARRFLDAGVALAAGSDAPYGLIDPWQSMAAAVMRETPNGRVMDADERLTPEQALGLFLGDLRRPGVPVYMPSVGDDADLCLMDVGWQRLRDDLSARHVAMTLCAGDSVFEKHPQGQGGKR